MFKPVISPFAPRPSVASKGTDVKVYAFGLDVAQGANSSGHEVLGMHPWEQHGRFN